MIKSQGGGHNSINYRSLISKCSRQYSAKKISSCQDFDSWSRNKKYMGILMTTNVF